MTSTFPRARRRGSSRRARQPRECGRTGAAHRVEDLVPLLSAKTRLVTVSLVSFLTASASTYLKWLRQCGSTPPALLAVDVTQAARSDSARPRRGPDRRSTHKDSRDPRRRVGRRAEGAHRSGRAAGGWFNLEDAFGPNRFEKAVSKPRARRASPWDAELPRGGHDRAGLEYVRNVGEEHRRRDSPRSWCTAWRK